MDCWPFLLNRPACWQGSLSNKGFSAWDALATRQHLNLVSRRCVCTSVGASWTSASHGEALALPPWQQSGGTAEAFVSATAKSSTRNIRLETGGGGPGEGTFVNPSSAMHRQAVSWRGDECKTSCPQPWLAGLLHFRICHQVGQATAAACTNPCDRITRACGREGWATHG